MKYLTRITPTTSSKPQMKRFTPMILAALLLCGVASAAAQLTQGSVSVLRIDTERTLLSKIPNATPKLIQRHTYYVADNGWQRHEMMQVENGKITVEINLWAEHQQITLDPQAKQATIRSAAARQPRPTARIGRMISPQSRTDLGNQDRLRPHVARWIIHRRLRRRSGAAGRLGISRFRPVRQFASGYCGVQLG